MIIKNTLNSIETITAEIKGQLTEGGNILNGVRQLDERVDLLREVVEGNSMDNVKSIRDWETWERERSEDRRRECQPWNDHSDVPSSFSWGLILTLLAVGSFWGFAAYVVFSH